MAVQTKHPTGITGLDQILHGGIYPGHGLMLIGGPGTGKTILLSQFIYEGIKKFKQNGVFVTFEERPQYIIENLKSFGWDFDKLVKEKKVQFVDASPGFRNEEISLQYDLEPILERIKYAVNKIKAHRVVIDGLGNLFEKFSNKNIIRDIVYRICDQLKTLGICYLISTEQSQNPGQYSVEEYVSDGVMELSRSTSQNKVFRNLEVIKTRGTAHVPGPATFEITNSGVCIYPEILIETPSRVDSKHSKAKFGIPTLDKALDGGIPEGSNVLLVGGAGTGKTTLSMSFLYEGLKNNENALCINFKDSDSAILSLTNHLGWGLKKFVQQKKLKFITALDHPDKMLYSITSEAKKMNAKRIIIDSLFFIDPTEVYQEKVVNFYINLMRWFKAREITSLFNYLSLENELLEEGAISSDSDALLRRVFNAVPDGIIVLRYNERDSIIHKELSILKMRASNHSTDVFEYINDNDGFRLIDKKKLLI